MDIIAATLQPPPAWEVEDGDEIPDGISKSEKALSSLITNAILGAAHRALRTSPLQYFILPRLELMLCPAEEADVQAIMSDNVMQLLFHEQYDAFWLAFPGAFHSAMGAIGPLAVPACRSVFLQLGTRYGTEIKHFLPQEQQDYFKRIFTAHKWLYTEWGYCLYMVNGLKHLQRHDAQLWDGYGNFNAAFAMDESLKRGYTLPMRVLRAVAAHSLDDDAGQVAFCRLFTSLQVRLYHKKADENFRAGERHCMIASQLPLRSLSKFVHFCIVNGMVTIEEEVGRHTLCRPEAHAEYWRNMAAWHLSERNELETLECVPNLFFGSNDAPRPRFNMVRQVARQYCASWCGIPLERYLRTGPRDGDVDWRKQYVYHLLIQLAFTTRALARDILLPDSSPHVSLTAPYVKQWYFEGTSDLSAIAHEVLHAPVQDLVRAARWSGAASDFCGFTIGAGARQSLPMRIAPAWERNATWVRMCRPRRDMVLRRAQSVQDMHATGCSELVR